MKKLTPKRAKELLWNECKRITRERYKKPYGWNCFTCGRIIDEPAKAQTGHFIASSICGAFLRYDLRNLRIQCYNCNINAGGNGSAYYKALVDENGQEYVDQLFKDKQVSIKADIIWLMTLLDEYKKL